ncbi:transporter [Pseudaestuariivita atlantica]|uniref:Transporter n=2 Tax=Pseudaestuariivita atlantica TaxID=1317121 RepID=A0A0L1JNX7_9RHOB|nr:transporter [Pseudaestuariivita atlantica]
MALGFFLFSIVDTTAKFLTDTFHPLQIVWMRQLGLLAGVLVMMAAQGMTLLRTKAPGLQITRGVLAAASATLFIYAVAYVPLADAVAITFVAPFMVTVLGALLLKEQVGLRRWTAVTIGFLGALIIIRPGMGVLHPAAGLLVLAALFFALRQIASRVLGSADPTRTTVAYTAITASAVLTVPMLFVWQTPGNWQAFALIALLAILAGVAETMIIRALELAEAVVLAPIHYTLLIWGTTWGWLVFGQLPDIWTWIGAAIIIVSGLYTLHRERQAKRR